MFNKDLVLANLEKLRRPNGAFIASDTPDYRAMWIRDTLYASFVYWYLREYEKFCEGVWIVFEYFKKDKIKILTRIASPVDVPGGIIHAKKGADTLDEIVEDFNWGNAQWDALGLFLHIVAHAHFNNVRIIRDDQDNEILQLLVGYLRSVEYWKTPDFGIWEWCKIRHLSSIGAVLAGLTNIKRERLAIVPDPLVQLGERAFDEIYPFESRDNCGQFGHSHDCDVAQLLLIWPYHLIKDIGKQDELLSRIIVGHNADNGDHHCLLQKHGFNRHWGDSFYRSNEGELSGVSAAWPMFHFVVSIIYSQRREFDRAIHWFQMGQAEMVGDNVPELYQNGRPNEHMPLAWGNALAIIAWTKLPDEYKATA